MFKENMLEIKEGCDTYCESLGITQDRANELTGQVLAKTPELRNVSKMLDWIWNHETLTFEEKVFACYKAGVIMGGFDAFKKEMGFDK